MFLRPGPPKALFRAGNAGKKSLAGAKASSQTSCQMQRCCRQHEEDCGITADVDVHVQKESGA
eukprot:6245665-Prorocentrum_lima.AAC.1